MRVLLALGGNAMTSPDGRARPEDQISAAAVAMAAVADLAAVLRLPQREDRNGIVARALRLDSGVELGSFTVAYQTYGALNAQRSNPELVCSGGATTKTS